LKQLPEEGKLPMKIGATAYTKIVKALLGKRDM
jgi:hypothetical protein